MNGHNILQSHARVLEFGWGGSSKIRRVWSTRPLPGREHGCAADSVVRRGRMGGCVRARSNSCAPAGDGGSQLSNTSAPALGKDPTIRRRACATRSLRSSWIRVARRPGTRAGLDTRRDRGAVRARAPRRQPSGPGQGGCGQGHAANPRARGRPRLVSR